MPNQKPNGAKPTGESGGRRRRRRSRGGQNAGNRPANQTNQTLSSAAVQSVAVNDSDTAPTAHGAGGRRRARGNGGKTAQNRATAAGQNAAPNSAEIKAKGGRSAAPAAATKAGRRPAPQQSHTARRGGKGRRGASDNEEDVGLLLITRRPPKQKFANFEEYIAAHGGVTVPVEGEEAADPTPAPEEET